MYLVLISAMKNIQQGKEVRNAGHPELRGSSYFIKVIFDRTEEEGIKPGCVWNKSFFGRENRIAGAKHCDKII